MHSEIGFTFAPRRCAPYCGQDPDVIMIGEIRDLETAEIAIRSALTGHVVLSTVHTNDAHIELHAPGRHGRRAVPGSGARPRRAGTAPRAQGLSQLLRIDLAARTGRRLSRRAPRKHARQPLGRRRRLRPLPPHRISRPHRHLRTGADVGGPAGHDRFGRAPERSETPWRGNTAAARWSRMASSRLRAATPRSRS